MIQALWGLIGRFATAALLLSIVATGCTGDGGSTTYPDAPIKITSRWWLAPGVAQAPDGDDPEALAAAQVLQTFLGSDSAETMGDVSIGPAKVFADFMIVMELISGSHPMEEVVSRRVPNVASRDSFGDLQIDAEITADRSTGSGSANRTTFEEFVMRSGPDGELQLVDFRRDGTWISELVAEGDKVRPVENENGAFRIIAVMRSEIGRYMVAGVITEAAVEQWALSDAYLESIVGDQLITQSLSDIGPRASEGLLPFLITFDAGASADQGARLVLPPLETVSQNDLVLEIPGLGVSRAG